ncbi:MAG: tetratricopeptide repeat protein, partial [Phycisphaeraceae bacterium JB051]
KWPAEFSRQLDAYEAMFDTFAKQDVQVALDMAKSGWTLAQFLAPDYKDRDVLKAKGLYPADENDRLKEALKTYYQSIQHTRKAPAFEKDLIALIANPDNESLYSKIALGLYKHLKTLDLSDKSKITPEMIIPDLIWTQAPKQGNKADISEDEYNRWNLATYFFSTGSALEAREAMRWNDTLQRLDLAIQQYPYQPALVRRAYDHLFKGDQKKAFEDMAVSVAMSAYAHSRSFNKRLTTRNDWYVNGLPLVLVLADVAYDYYHNDGPFPSAPMIDALEHFRGKRWLNVAEYVGTHLKGHDPGWSPNGHLANQLRYNNNIKGKMLDALADAMDMPMHKMHKETFLKWADAIGDGNHPVFELIKFRAEGGDNYESRVQRLLNWIAFDAMYHPQANVEYAKILEKQGKIDDALLHYNVASHAKPLAELKGIQKIAAENRNRLEGSSDKKAIADRYLKLVGYVQSKIKDHRTKYIGSAQLVMMINRLEKQIVLNDTAYAIRSDAYRTLKQYELAAEDLKRVLKSGKHRQPGKLRGLMGMSYNEAGLWSESISVLTDAIGNEGQPNWIYYYLADSCRQQGNMEQALKYYTKMIELEPEELRSLVERSKIYEYVMRDTDKALADIEKYKAIQLKRNPKYKSAVIDMRLYNLKRDRVFKN